jgi:hypothetical protein
VYSCFVRDERAQKGVRSISLVFHALFILVDLCISGKSEPKAMATRLLCSVRTSYFDIVLTRGNPGYKPQISISFSFSLVTDHEKD